MVRDKPGPDVQGDDADSIKRMEDDCARQAYLPCFKKRMPVHTHDFVVKFRGIGQSRGIEDVKDQKGEYAETCEFMQQTDDLACAASVNRA